MDMDVDRNQKHPSTRLSEVDVIYNPSLGAYLLWRACNGYFSESEGAMPIALSFLILPLTLHGQSRRLVSSTLAASGLAMFTAKLGTHQEDLLAVHQRALELRELSLSSLTLATATNLLTVLPEHATMMPATQVDMPRASDRMHQLGKVAEKLGTWFARLPIDQVRSLLRVSF